MPSRTLREARLAAVAVAMLVANCASASPQSPPPARPAGEDDERSSRPGVPPRRGGPTLCECLTKAQEARDEDRCQGMLSVLELPAIELARRDCAKGAQRR